VEEEPVETKQQIVERLHLYYTNLLLHNNKAVPAIVENSTKNNLLLDMDLNDELASIALGFKS
jgi:hypothetical protein